MRTNVICAIAVIFALTALALTGCPVDEEGGDNDITYTAVQTGGTANTADSTGIVFTFSASIDGLGLSAADIEVTGTTAQATKSTGTTTLNGSGKSWTLPITVTSAGNVTVKITKNGIEAKTKTVAVHKKTAGQGEGPTDITYTLEQEGGENNETDSTGIIFTFSEPIDDLGLTADDIEVSDAAEKDPDAELTGSGTTWTLSPIIVSEAGEAAVSINKTGIDGETIHVTVYKEGEDAPTLTSINATYTGADIYLNTPLDSLKDNLIVKAHYSNHHEIPLSASEYTLSVSGGGALAVGSATIIVTYNHDGGTKTADFTVTVTTHTAHTWGTWLQTKPATETVDGEETQTCTVCYETETRPLYQTGTAGLQYGEIYITVEEKGYSVHGSVIPNNQFPTLHIPAYWRPADSTNYDDYKPVTTIGNGDDKYTTPAFGGTNSSFNANSTTTTITFAENSRLTTINAHAFRFCTKLTSIDIPASVTTIGNNAFAECTSLTSVTLPANVILNGNTFSNTGITSLTIPAGVTFSGSEFSSCTKLTTVTLDESITVIGSSMFYGCTSLQSINIPQNLTSIGSSAFANCSSLTGNITIPASVASITAGAFNGCTSLTGITVNDGNASYASQDGIVYNKEKTAFVVVPPGLSGSVTLPASITSIAASTFTGRAGLTAITIPTGVTTIGTNAFQNCTGLTSIDIPAGVTSISNTVFSGCTSLATITIPEGVTSIGTYAFSGCTSLASITIPASVTTIGTNAFQNCTSLTGITVDVNNANFVSQDGILYNKEKTAFVVIPQGITGSVTIPEGITDIGANAFQNRASLTAITIPASVTSINNNAFSGCTGLTSITVDENNPNYASVNGMLYNKEKTVLIIGISGALTIPEGVTTIGDYAFQNFTSLTSVTIPASVLSIGQYAFNGCTGLTTVTISEGVTSIGDRVFQNCTNLTAITIPASVTSIGQMVFYNCTSLTAITVDEDNADYASQDGILYDKEKTTLIQGPGGISGNVTIPNSVTSIGNFSFNGSTKLTGITIPADVTIGNNAFANCTGLTSATISQGVTIGSAAFQLCTGLASVTISEGVTEIGQSAFYGCSSLTSVTIPSSVTFTAYSAFMNCTGLTSVTISEGVTSLGGGSTFSGCTSLTSITIPASVTSTGSSTFKDCTSLTSVTISEGVTSFGGSMFENCSSLASVTIPASLTTIGSSTFKNCTSLTSVTISEGVTSFGSGMFENCSSLASVTIPASVTRIANSAFMNCTGLASITIPASVTEILTQAFSGCTSLASVTFNGSAAVIANDYTFPNNLKTLYDAQSEKSGTYVSNLGIWSKQ